MSYNCKECQSQFDSLKSLHSHIKKHGMMVGDYYVKNYPRYNKLTGSAIQFKNYEDYFDRNFATYEQMIQWINIAPQDEVKPYIFERMQKLLLKKELNYAPNTVELFSYEMPTIDSYKKHFGTYGAACKQLNVKPMFGAALPEEFHRDCRSFKIFIDTREQQPLNFKNCQMLKLDVGDYAVNGDDFDYTYVDRKSFADLCNTLTAEYKRFVRELQRCRSLGCYLFIVTETNLYQMEKRNAYSPKRYNLGYVFHNLRELQREFRDCCQFVFSGNRSNSSILIPKLLLTGKKIWNTDIQYFLDKGEMEYFNRKKHGVGDGTSKTE